VNLVIFTRFISDGLHIDIVSVCKIIHLYNSNINPPYGTHFIADCPKRKKFDSSNKYNYNNRNDSSDKGEGKKKYCFRDNKKKKFQKMMFRVCATLSDLDFSSDDSSSSEEDERPKCKMGDFTGLCLMGKSSWHISDSDSDVSDDSSPEGLSL
jgi:hypothetical protein